jgi:hypothetical protein
MTEEEIIGPYIVPIGKVYGKSPVQSLIEDFARIRAMNASIQKMWGEIGHDLLEPLPNITELFKLK